MPPGKKLPPAVIADFETCSRSGAPDPRKDNAPGVATDDPKNSKRNHWAFQPLRSTDPPKSSDNGAVHAIDAFLQVPLRDKGLSISPFASRRVLVRRLYFDLIGLPPTPEQMTSALADQSNNWPAKLVNELLSSPHHGERWGQHWLDVARYADSSGYSVDSPRPTMYRLSAISSLGP